MTIRRAHLATLAAAALIGGSIAAPAPAAAIGMESPSPPPPAANAPMRSTPPVVKKKKPSTRVQKQRPTTQDKDSDKRSEQQFLDGYHAAYAMIYDKGDYQDAIPALRALNHDNHPDVATLLGYASRKLGRYADAKYWYDKALAADPRHESTLSYYGMWHAEQGNRLKAEEYLEKVRAICGTECRAYTELKGVIDHTATY
jgi:tetratricopeptide (TPR) repeat protein